MRGSAFLTTLPASEVTCAAPTSEALFQQGEIESDCLQHDITLKAGSMPLVICRLMISDRPCSACLSLQAAARNAEMRCIDPLLLKSDDGYRVSSTAPLIRALYSMGQEIYLAWQQMV